MKSLLSTLTAFAFTLAAATLSLADNFDISQISWQADQGEQVWITARVNTPEGCTVSALHQTGFLASNQQQAAADAKPNISYSMQGFNAQQNWINMRIKLDSIPENGIIRIDDSLTFHSYQGYELSPAHPIKPKNPQDEFYFHGYQYSLSFIEGNRLHIRASVMDPAVERYRLLDENGSQIAEVFANNKSTSIPYERKPHSLVIIRKKNAQQIQIELQKEINITGELLAITKGRMSNSITPQATKPAEELTAEESDLLQALPAFTLRQWSYSDNQQQNTLWLNYMSPKLPQHPFTLLSKDYERYFKLAKSRDRNITGASKYIVSFTQASHSPENRLDLTYRGLEDLELDEDIDIKLAYGEVYSKRHELKLHDKGEIYLKDKCYHYELKPAEPEREPLTQGGIRRPKTASIISITCEQKEPVLPEVLFYDAQGKAIRAHASRNYANIMNYRGELATTPHSVQLVQKVGELDTKAKLKTKFKLPTITPITKPALTVADNPTKEKRVEPSNLIWWRENQEQIKLIVRIPKATGYEQKLVTPFGLLNRPKEGELRADFNFASDREWTTRPLWLTIVLSDIPESGEIKLRDGIAIRRREMGADSHGAEHIYALDVSIQLPKNVLAMMKGAAGPVVPTELAEIPKENGKDAKALLSHMQFGLDSWQIDYPGNLYLRFRHTQPERYILHEDIADSVTKFAMKMKQSTKLNERKSEFNHHFTAYNAKQWCNICTYSNSLPSSVCYRDIMAARVQYNEAISDIVPVDDEKGTSFKFLNREFKAQYDAATETLTIQYDTPSTIYPRFRLYYADGTSRLAQGISFRNNSHHQFSVKTKPVSGIQITAPQSLMRVNHPIKFQFDLPIMKVGSN